MKQEKSDEPASELLERIAAEKAKLIAEKKIKKEKPLLQIEEDEKSFVLPQGWTWCRLGEVIMLLSGQDFPPTLYNDDHKGKPYITGASNLTSNGVLENRWTPRPTVIAKRGDFLLTCKGSGVGKTAFMDLPEAHIARQIMALRPYAGVDVGYVALYVSANFEFLKASANGLIPGIQRQIVVNMVLPLPPLSEQHRIVAKVKEMLSACDAFGGEG